MDGVEPTISGTVNLPHGWNSPEPLKLQTPFKYTCALVIGNQLKFYFPEDRIPNRWRRFWYWALLGWKWEKV